MALYDKILKVLGQDENFISYINTLHNFLCMYMFWLGYLIVKSNWEVNPKCLETATCQAVISRAHDNGQHFQT